jgi:plastocyanin
MRARAAAIGGLTTAALLLCATGAQAATKTVSAGPPLKTTPKGVPADGDGNAFFRKDVTIHAGDRVKWVFSGFHDVVIPAKGDKPPSLAVPDPAHPVSGVNDAGGAAFFFNGLPRFPVNPILLGAQGGKTYTGKQRLNSALPLAGAPKPYKVRFTKPGTYTYYCSIHLGNPSMQGTVRVLKRKRAVPSAKADRRAVKRQIARLVARLKKDDKKAAPTGNLVRMGVDSSTSTLLRFSPTSKTVKVGDSITFAMSPKTQESHTVTFGPEKALSDLANAFIGPDAAVGGLALNPQVAYPSDVQLVHSATVHGNGFLNTGVLDRDADSPPPPSATVKFTEAGSFRYICLIHPDMVGTIVVQR